PRFIKCVPPNKIFSTHLIMEIAMKKSLATSLSIVAFLSLSVPAGAQTALSSLTSATAANSFDNGNYLQQWTWNSLSTSSAALLVTSNSTALSASGIPSLFQSLFSGANSNANVQSVAGDFWNTHTGTGSQNFAVYGNSAGGAVNYGVAGA